MARKKQSLPFDKQQGGVIAIQRRLLESVAYLTLSPQAKALITLLQVHWRNDKPVAYGVREAMAKIPCSKLKARETFTELSEKGFIEMIDEAWFDSRTGSKSRTWRLTWLPWYGKAPTNEWEKNSSTGLKTNPERLSEVSKTNPVKIE
jgi:hypothetical protein